MWFFRQPEELPSNWDESHACCLAFCVTAISRPGPALTVLLSGPARLARRGGGQRGEAAGDDRAAEGRVRGRAEGARYDHLGARQDGAHGGRGQAAGGGGRSRCHQPAGRFERGEAPMEDSLGSCFR